MIWKLECFYDFEIDFASNFKFQLQLPRPKFHCTDTSANIRHSAKKNHISKNANMERKSFTMQVLIIQTGGTIDKDYPVKKGQYPFEIGESAARSILEQHRIPLRVRYETVCQKDSLQISDEDRLKLLTVCNDCAEQHVLITHGTDTLLATAAFLGHQNLPKKIVLTGAFRPEKFKDSDASLNIGLSLGALQCLESNGIYVAMNGVVLPWRRAMRDPDTGHFVCKV